MLFCPYIRDAWWGSMVSFHLSEGAMYPEWNHPVRVSVTPAPCYLFRFKWCHLAVESGSCCFFFVTRAVDPSRCIVSHEQELLISTRRSSRSTL